MTNDEWLNQALNNALTKLENYTEDELNSLIDSCVPDYIKEKTLATLTPTYIKPEQDIFLGSDSLFNLAA